MAGGNPSFGASRYAQLARDEFQVLAAEEPEDGFGLAVRGEAAALAWLDGGFLRVNLRTTALFPQLSR